ncbi:histidine--tRNA ligase [Pendulispora albinea]|uniref:Histidine--tRNA ligase n=1 Tax=Pendulispora albinea TaxID=2741071 RepID=A0ABZ2MCD6_9BACT
MNDVLPDEMARWHLIERLFAEAARSYGFREIRTPIVEPTGLFVRTIGEATDVVEKEMYSFTHRDEALTLRPEATAGVARAYVEHRVHTLEPVTKWFCTGPMFRAEKPQRGRYRQFYQLDCEIFGDPGPGCDAELIDMLVGLFDQLKIPDVRVLVNSIGGAEARARYRDGLVAFLEPRREELSAESQRRLQTNPLRILDSKDPRDKVVVAEAPTIEQYLSDDDRAHFDGLVRALTALGVPFTIDPHLVRGLDYYTRTLFEIKGASAKLGAGDTLVGGGRYDNMIEELGGPKVPAIGFASGIERLIIASEATVPGAIVDAYIAPLGASAVEPALVLGRDLRREGVAVEVDSRGGSLKSQLRRANALSCGIALILGDSEVESGTVQVKDLAAHTQDSIARAEVVRFVSDRLKARSR